jgi:hypothetical protein
MRRSLLTKNLFSLAFPLAAMAAAAPQPGCALFKAAAGAAPQVAGWLLEKIGQILSGADYQQRLDEVAEQQGPDYTAAAVREYLRTATVAPQGRAAIITMPPPDPTKSDRAELWLRRRGLWQKP